MKKGQRLLEELIRKDFISGFNRSFSPFDLTNNTLIVLGNFHDTERYKQAVLRDVAAYPEIHITVKRKKGFTKWEPGYKIRDDDGNLYPGLQIKDQRKYICLENIPTATLEEAGFSQEYIQSLIGVNDSYEIRVESKNLHVMQDLAGVFIEKTDVKAIEKWPDLYDVSVIFLLGLETMPDFLPATMYQQRKRRTSLNFIQTNLDKEKEKIVEEIGFEKAPCLANSRFIRRCCN